MNFYCRLNSEDQVAEKFYALMRIKDNVDKSRNLSLVIVVIFHILAGLYFHLSGYSFWLAAIFILPGLLVYYAAPWLNWRMSIIAYKQAFPDMTKLISYDGDSVKIIKTKNDGFQSETISISKNDIYKIVENLRYIVLFFDESVELLINSCEAQGLLEHLSSQNSFRVMRDKAPGLYYPLPSA